MAPQLVPAAPQAAATVAAPQAAAETLAHQQGGASAPPQPLSHASLATSEAAQHKASKPRRRGTRGGRAAQQRKLGKASVSDGNRHISHTQHIAAISQLEAEKAELVAACDKLATANGKLTTKLAAKRDKLTSKHDELATASENLATLVHQHDTLVHTHAKLVRELQNLKLEGEHLKCKLWHCLKVLVKATVGPSTVDTPEHWSLVLAKHQQQHSDSIAHGISQALDTHSSQLPARI